MFALVVRFDLLDEQAAEAFDRLVVETVEEVRVRESGTVVYAVHSVVGAPLSRVFYELYEDRAAFEAHEEQSHTRRFLAEREQYLRGSRVEFLEPLVGKGV